MSIHALGLCVLQFVIDVLVQIVIGILVDYVSGDSIQLIVIIGIQALYLVWVFIMCPFTDPMVILRSNHKKVLTLRLD